MGPWEGMAVRGAFRPGPAGRGGGGALTAAGLVLVLPPVPDCCLAVGLAAAALAGARLLVHRLFIRALGCQKSARGCELR